MKVIQNWQDYTNFAFESLGDLKGHDEDVLFLNLAESIGNLLGDIKRNIVSQKVDVNAMIKHGGDILWALAVIEEQYDLSSPRSSKMLHYKVQNLNKEEIIPDYISMQADICMSLTEACEGCMEKDLELLQFASSKIFSCLMDISIFNNFTIGDCILSSVKTINEQNSVKTLNKKEPAIPQESKYKKEYEEAKIKSKNLKIKQVTMDILNSAPVEGSDGISYSYQGVKIKYGRKTKTFSSGDIIIDFFNSSNFIAESEFKGLNYNLIYTPKFRVILENLHFTKTVLSAYIHEGKLVLAADMKQSNDQTDVFADKTKYRPVLIRPNMKELDDLLIYISKFKK